MIYIFSNNEGQPVTKAFTQLHYTSAKYTSLHLSTLDLFPFKLHPNTSLYTSLPSHSVHVNLVLQAKCLVLEFQPYYLELVRNLVAHGDAREGK